MKYSQFVDSRPLLACNLLGKGTSCPKIHPSLSRRLSVHNSQGNVYCFALLGSVPSSFHYDRKVAHATAAQKLLTACKMHANPSFSQRYLTLVQNCVKKRIKPMHMHIFDFLLEWHCLLSRSLPPLFQGERCLLVYNATHARYCYVQLTWYAARYFTKKITPAITTAGKWKRSTSKDPL